MKRPPVMLETVFLAATASVAAAVAWRNDALASFDPAAVREQSIAAVQRVAGVSQHAAGYVALALGVVALALVVWLARAVYDVLYAPFDRMDLRIDPWLGTDSRKDRVKRVGAMPPPYPNGWFRIVCSQDVARDDPGCVISERVLGRLFSVFRGRGGTFIVEASCPRCGATMDGENGARAVFEENAVQCGGCGTEYDGRTGDERGKENGDDDRVFTPSYDCSECNGHIYIWHDAQGREPYMKLMRPAAMNDGSFLWHGRTEHIVTCHAAEIPENGADVAHLNILHQTSIFKSLEGILFHQWTADWRAGKSDDADDWYQTHIVITQKMKLSREPDRLVIPGSGVHVEVTQSGPGLVFLHFDMPIGRCWVIEAVTPISPMRCKYHHIIFAQWRVPRLVARWVLHSLITQAERDVPVWNHKVYLNKPLIVRGDGPIAQFRRWFKQFYCDESMALARRLHPDLSLLYNSN